MGASRKEALQALHEALGMAVHNADTCKTCCTGHCRYQPSDATVSVATHAFTPVIGWPHTVSSMQVIADAFNRRQWSFHNVHRDAVLECKPDSRCCYS